MKCIQCGESLYDHEDGDLQACFEELEEGVFWNDGLYSKQPNSLRKWLSGPNDNMRKIEKLCDEAHGEDLSKLDLRRLLDHIWEIAK